ncbi:MAG: hypothetical protein ACFFCS_21815 [Candidatus Hodarchaeota archaeon]
MDDRGNEISGFNAPMATFRMLWQQGYDWFRLIDARECDADYSGRGVEKGIKMENLEKALEELTKHDPGGRLARIPFDMSTQPQLPDDLAAFSDMYTTVRRGTVHEFEDTFRKYKEPLQEFMEDCIAWGNSTNNDEITIVFA